MCTMDTVIVRSRLSLLLSLFSYVAHVASSASLVAVVAFAGLGFAAVYAVVFGWVNTFNVAAEDLRANEVAFGCSHGFFASPETSKSLR